MFYVNLAPTRIQNEWCLESDHKDHSLGGRACLNWKGIENVLSSILRQLGAGSGQ